MDEASITQYITDTFEDVDAVVASAETGAPEAAWGDTFFFHEPGRKLPPDHKFPFATIVTKDYGDFDCASNLNRSSVFRLNIGISKPTYLSLFRPGAAGVVDTTHDFTALDILLPHPIYGNMFWVCVLNPSAATFQEIVRPLLAEAYELDVKRHARKASPPRGAER